MVSAISVVSIVSAVFMICYPCCAIAHHPPGASGVLSMVFIPADHKAPGKSCRINQTPCLEEMQHDKSWRRHLKTRQTAKPISMVSDPREFTVPFKNAQSKLIEYAAPTPSKAACVLSMVFELGGLLFLGV